MSPRYAIYYAPAAESALWRLGSATLGYDAATGRDVDLEPPPAVSQAEWRGWTEGPRRYGFHATLKAPFTLRSGLELSDILALAGDLAAATQRVMLPRLSVQLLDGFAALTPNGPVPALAELETACVHAFEPLRAEPGESDRARRLATGLTARQAGYLDRFGYPYVLEEFRFHMTLSGRLSPEVREPVRAALAERFSEAGSGAAIDALAVFEQETRQDRFRIVGRVSLLGRPKAES